MRFAPEYITYVLNDNFEDAKELFLSPLMAIHHAHLVMLAAQNIVSAEDAHALRVALDSVSLTEVRGATYDGACEDLFFYVERLIEASCGADVAGRLHTARSRNDIDMTMYRMRQREFILGLLAASCELRRVLLEVAGRHRHTVFAVHTHTQRAQPTTVAHYLLAVVEQLERDGTRLSGAYERTNRKWVLPMPSPPKFATFGQYKDEFDTEDKVKELTENLEKQKREQSKLKDQQTLVYLDNLHENQKLIRAVLSDARVELKKKDDL